MNRIVRTTSRAESEVATIAQFIASHSPQGAASWLDAYDRMVERLAEHAETCSLAPENQFLLREVRQAFFRTAHGRFYRALFTIAENEVRIVGIRGPGLQPPPTTNLDG